MAVPVTVRLTAPVFPPKQFTFVATALRTGKASIVIVIDADTAPQGPAGSLVVNVNITDPAVISAAVGV